jgi:hypothetical protein
MIIEKHKEAGFDYSDLEYRPGSNTNLCAFEVLKNENKELIVNHKLKNIAHIEVDSVNFNMDKFKYQATFDGIIVQAMVPIDEDKYLAVASIDQLKSYLPQKVDLDVNKDLMGVAFDAFVVNRGNKNGHVISTEVALSMVENFINKPFNIEHNRKTVVGFCTGYGFSEFGTSNPLTLEEIAGTNKPFNVVLSGYVWKIVNPEFAQELVKSSDPSSDEYLSVSASWELGFNEFNIAKGNKNLADASIIEDEDEILNLKDSLKVFGGRGSDKDGNLLLLNLQGSVLPLGIGFTNNPAADVKGVVISYDKQEVEIVEDDAVNKNENQSNEMNKKSVSIENNNVKSTMQINKIEDITEDSIKEVSASEVREFISNRIADLSKDWQTKVEEKDNAITNAEEKINMLKADLEAIKAESEKVKEEFNAMQESIKAQEIEAAFQRRMSLLDEEFNLSNEDREIVAEDLRAIENDESFEKWYNRFSTIASAKKKQAKQEVEVKASTEIETVEKEVVVEEKVEEAVVLEKTEEPEEKTVEDIVSSAKEEKETIPNTSSTQEISLVEKISAAFNKNSVKINR